MAYIYDDPEPVICNTCGSEVDQDARFCENCGAVLDSLSAGPTYTPGVPLPSGPSYGAMGNVPNYLVQAILVTVFGALCSCFGLIPGIVAIVFAAQVNSKLAAGDYDGALRSSSNAKTWCWIALAVTIVLFIIALVVRAMGILAGLTGF